VRRMMDILKREAFEPGSDRADDQVRYGRTAVLLRAYPKSQKG